jgi:hypothetical protein
MAYVRFMYGLSMAYTINEHIPNHYEPKERLN